MNKDSHGVALIINNIEWQHNRAGNLMMKTRDGAKEDADVLQTSLEALGYYVTHKENLIAEKMEQKLMKVLVCAKYVRLNDDSFICFISSHGGKLGVYMAWTRSVFLLMTSASSLSQMCVPDSSTNQRSSLFRLAVGDQQVNQ